MSHGPEHHIEHAEHAAHATHDEFNKRVTMSIAIVAAVLACVTMLGHRAHNDVLFVQGEVLHLQGDALRVQGDALRIQSEALQLQTMASIESTNAANKWAYYQAKNLFHLESKIMMDLLKVVAIDAKNQEELKKVRGVYKGNVDKYDKKLPEIQAEAEALVKKSDGYMQQAQEKIREAHTKMVDYQNKMDESAKKRDQGHEIHAKADRFDYGELGLQFGVVLCSLAILMRSRGFWIAGLISAVIGALIALSGLLGLFIAHH
jgi:hypothetical protein